jgi:cyclic beta-1,2-glucan synthetase
LGLRLTGGKLHFEPCIPKEWKAYEIIYTYGKTKYFIKIENPQGVNRGAVEMTLDGIAVSEVALVDDASEHHLRVTLLAAPGSSVPPDAPKISADSDLSAS